MILQRYFYFLSIYLYRGKAGISYCVELGTIFLHLQNFKLLIKYFKFLRVKEENTESTAGNEETNCDIVGWDNCI